MEILKVKAHDTEGINEAIDPAGNELADQYAKMSANTNSLPAADKAVIRRLDGKAWLIRERLIAIVNMQPKRVKQARGSDKIPRRTPQEFWMTPTNLGERFLES